VRAHIQALPRYVQHVTRMRHSVDGPLTERWRLAARTLEGEGWWRQPMRLPQRGGQHSASQVSVGEKVFIGKNAWVNLTTRQARLTIGDGVAIGNSFTVACADRVEVGAGVMMSDRVTLLDQLHDFRGWVGDALDEGRVPMCTWALTEAAPVVIGPGTWLGIGVVVLPGVTIGQGCAVGANAVVTRDLPDFAVAVGIPARVIGSALGNERGAEVQQL
jgi:acetyltransferase-like isoleucine patch superfamily enzyme